jgi:hypothetical protein
MQLKKLASLIIGSLILGIASAIPAVAVHDSGANGNSIIMSDYGNPATTYSATAVSQNAVFDCFNGVPETRLTFNVGGLGSGLASVSGGDSSRFVVTWTQASTSNTVTFSPRFVSKQTPSATSTGSFTLTINYTTFSLQVSVSDTILISYAAPNGGDSDITATPNAGGTFDPSDKAISFSGLVFDAAKFASALRSGSCFPVSGGSMVNTPACEVNGSPATLAQIGIDRSSIAAGESYQITLGGQPLGVVCQITLNSGFWVRTSINSTVVVVSGTSFSSNVRFSTITPISYTSLVNGLVNQGYTTAIQTGDVWKREYFTTTAQPNSGDTPVATQTMILGVSGGQVVTPTSGSGADYSGPQIMAIENPRPIIAGGSLVFTGRGLESVTQATIGDKAASMSFDANKGLSIGTPAGLAPGKYDLVMQSSFGKLTFINGVSIKAPTPTATIGFRSDAQHLNEKQVLDLVAFNQTLNQDYEKVRCIVNASDPKTAKRIADLVCAQVARGEARNVEVIKDIRNNYSGEGFWVRVYAAG